MLVEHQFTQSQVYHPGQKLACSHRTMDTYISRFPRSVDAVSLGAMLRITDVDSPLIGISPWNKHGPGALTYPQLLSSPQPQQPSEASPYWDRNSYAFSNNRAECRDCLPKSLDSNNESLGYSLFTTLCVSTPRTQNCAFPFCLPITSHST